MDQIGCCVLVFDQCVSGLYCSSHILHSILGCQTSVCQVGNLQINIVLLNGSMGFRGPFLLEVSLNYLCTCIPLVYVCEYQAQKCRVECNVVNTGGQSYLTNIVKHISVQSVLTTHCPIF